MLGLSSVLAVPGVDAESIQDMKEKKEAIQEKRSGVQSGIHNAEQDIKKLQGQQESLEDQISRIEKEISDSEAKIKEKDIQIKETQAEIEKLKEEIAVLIERIEKRNELLKERAVSFQESGGDISYLEVLLGSSSFSDFVGRVNAVATIVEADREILEQHEADKKELEESQKAVEQKMADLQSMLAELKEMNAQLTNQKQQKDALMAKLEKEEEQTQELKMSLQEEEENLAAQQSAIQKAIELEQSRRAELEAARKRAAAEARSGSGGGGESVSAAPRISSGAFTNPSAGRVTSKMGPRWNKQHAGIDIAKKGTVPVVASADGVVMRAYVSSTYGNCVMITHSINGQQYTTVYAHMRSMNVSTGQVVAKGQKIGLMGNTGRSYGQHLHFEIHKGSWNVSKSNAVNPLSYVSY
ncbi:peptidase M23 [Bacillus sp. V59.32b]|nr:peptidase M23 [Bacillus sp. V59.32b]